MNAPCTVCGKDTGIEMPEGRGLELETVDISTGSLQVQMVVYVCGDKCRDELVSRFPTPDPEAA